MSVAVGGVEFIAVAALIGLAVMDGLGQKSHCYHRDKELVLWQPQAEGNSQQSFRNIDQAVTEGAF